jgi:hypothetical protein
MVVGGDIVEGFPRNNVVGKTLVQIMLRLHTDDYVLFWLGVDDGCNLLWLGNGGVSGLF